MTRISDQRDRGPATPRPGARPHPVFGEITAECARAGHAVKRADEMPRDRMQPRAKAKLAFDIRHHGLKCVLHRGERGCLAEQFGIDVEQTPRLLIGGAAQHDAIDMSKVRPRLCKTADATVDDDGHVRHRRLQPIDPVVVERRDVAIFLRRQSVEPGLAGVNDQRIRAGRDHSLRQRIEGGFGILIVDTDPAFDGDRDGHGLLHRRDASGDQRRLSHQAGAETALFHPVRRTTDIEVDFVVAEILADPGSRREIARIGAAELKRHRMLSGIEAKQPLPVAMKDGA